MLAVLAAVNTTASAFYELCRRMAKTRAGSFTLVLYLEEHSANFSRYV